jgi:alginate O-acetyltransferase complex protein AlgI
VLFNTFAFFLIFLPLALAGYFLLSRRSISLSVLFLFCASLYFYAYWEPRLLGLLLGSIAVNYAFGKWISRSVERSQPAKARLARNLGVLFNLLTLGFFKYSNFLVANLAWVTGLDLSAPDVKLPIGISFFTFTQIAYLVDCQEGGVKDYEATHYGLFVSYFPHLISGPILHHKEMMPQFDRAASHHFRFARLVVGMMFFTIGLLKKVLLADGIARFVGPVFDVNHAQLTVLEAWCGTLAYTFQLYFDFSAYCDMAYGLSYMFGIILPINFNSPYKARSIIDFWRRWHITLSRFLREYLYVRLGGNRLGSARRYSNLMTTMLLGGLWHGANWTFVIWGGLHGIYLIVNHAIRAIFDNRRPAIIAALAWPTTFLAVVIGWVFFRASSMSVAFDVLRGMFGGTYAGDVTHNILGLNRIMPVNQCIVWLMVLAALSFFAPNAYELIGKGELKPLEDRLDHSGGALLLGAMLVLTLLLLAISETRGVSEFLYFNF